MSRSDSIGAFCGGATATALLFLAAGVYPPSLAILWLAFSIGVVSMGGILWAFGG